MADPLIAAPEEALAATLPHERALALLRRRDFRRTYTAVVVSELGDSSQYVALMWFALVTAGPLGVVAVRLADSVPALLCGLHGGVIGDRARGRDELLRACLRRNAARAGGAPQRADGNSLVRSTAEAVRVGGWAVAAALLVVVPLSSFFLLNAGSFFLSALLIVGVRARRGPPDAESTPYIRESFSALPFPSLVVAVVAYSRGFAFAERPG